MDLIERVLPILGFLVCVTVIAELADRIGVFGYLAHHAARLARGSVLRLWLLVVVLATLATAVLSLDTTAVLLTPVVLALARRLHLDRRMFAFTTVWLANTASLFLPVSNLTNLLALHPLRAAGRPRATPSASCALTWPAAVTSWLVTVALLAVVFRRSLRGRYEPGGTARDPAPPAARRRPRRLRRTRSGAARRGRGARGGRDRSRRSCWSPPCSSIGRCWTGDCFPGSSSSVCSRCSSSSSWPWISASAGCWPRPGGQGEGWLGPAAGRRTRCAGGQYRQQPAELPGPRGGRQYAAPDRRAAGRGERRSADHAVGQPGHPAVGRPLPDGRSQLWTGAGLRSSGCCSSSRLILLSTLALWLVAA